MKQGDALCQALEGLGLSVQPGLDTSAGKAYVVYSFDTEAALPGDDMICIEQRRWSVFFVGPIGQDLRSLRNQIREVIQQLFGILPPEEDLTDNQYGQQYLYEFETIGGVGIG